MATMVKPTCIAESRRFGARLVGLGLLVVMTATACGTSDSVAWDLVAVRGERLTIDVQFGGSSCTRLHGVEVNEDEERVEIVASIDRVDAGDCTADLVIVRRKVELQRPLGDRSLEGCKQQVSCDLLADIVVAGSASAAASDDRGGAPVAPSSTGAAGTAVIEGTLTIDPPCVWVDRVPIQFGSPKLVTISEDGLTFASGTAISDEARVSGSGGYVSPDAAVDVTDKSLPEPCQPGLSGELFLVAGELTAR